MLIIGHVAICQIDSARNIECLVWTTPRERARLERWGDLIYFDGVQGLTREDYCCFVPSVLTAHEKIYPVAHAVARGETSESARFILQSLDELVPEWKKIRSAMFADQGIESKTYEGMLPGLRAFMCEWHLLHSGAFIFFSAAAKDRAKNVIGAASEEDMRKKLTVFRQSASLPEKKKMESLLQKKRHWVAYERNQVISICIIYLLYFYIIII